MWFGTVTLGAIQLTQELTQRHGGLNQLKPMADSSSTLQRVLVTGATGQQGGATLRALVKANEPHPKFEILAVTRNPDSGSAKALAKLPNVKLVKGDLDDAPAIFVAAGHVDAVFSVQIAVGNGATPDTEERQGKALADAAENANVKHFVYTSVDRAHIPKETGIPHFDSKYHIEEHVKTKKFSWTILRPVAFMDAFADPATVKFFATFIKQKLAAKKPIQLIAADDIGEFARIAFEEPDKYSGKAISLAGDEVTFAQMSKTYEKAKGSPVPTTFFFVPSLIFAMPGLMAKEMRTMFKFFNDPGYQASIEECRSIYPGLQNFDTFIRKH